MSIRRSTFDRQYEHVGNIRHGVQTGPWRVEFDADVETSNSNTKGAADNCLKIKQGSVVSLNAVGKYVLGCPIGKVANRPVPFISMKNVTDPDVQTGRADNTHGMAYSTYSAVGGTITAIPCTSGYEIETTEFKKDSYAPNDALIAGTVDELGKVVKASAAPGGAEAYLGFVSIPPSPDYLGNTRIAFFTQFIPAVTDQQEA